MKSMRVVAILVLLAVVRDSVANDAACPECGCCNRRVTCRLVCEDKDVKETRWNCECEDFCVPGPSHPCGEDCECDSSKLSGLWCIKLWQPGCAKVRSRKVLTKEEVTRTVPSHRWVVEEVCDGCGYSLSHACEIPVDAANQFDYEAGTPQAGSHLKTGLDAKTSPKSNSRSRHSSRGEE